MCSHTDGKSLAAKSRPYRRPVCVLKWTTKCRSISQHGSQCFSSTQRRAHKARTTLRRCWLPKMGSRALTLCGWCCTLCGHVGQENGEQGSVYWGIYNHLNLLCICPGLAAASMLYHYDVTWRWLSAVNPYTPKPAVWAWQELSQQLHPCPLEGLTLLFLFQMFHQQSAHPWKLLFAFPQLCCAL